MSVDPAAAFKVRSLAGASSLSRLGEAAKTNVFGEDPRGYLILASDEGIALIHVAASREGPKGRHLQTWKQPGVQDMLAYIKYEIDPTPSEAELR